jgi:hypothetical protein
MTVATPMLNSRAALLNRIVVVLSVIRSCCACN